MIPAKTIDSKGTRILAKSLYKELRGNGYSPNQILSLSTELIDLVTCDLKGARFEESANAETGAEAEVEQEQEQAGWRAAI